MPSQGQGKRRLTPQDIPVKRFRVSRACDQCRTAREKCDGNQPTCLPCVEGKRPCTYTSNPKKRGLQPGYIRGLEMTLAFVFQHNPDIENLVNTQLAQEHTILLARGTKDSNRLHKSWTKSKFCRDITRALAGEHIDSGDEKVPSSDDESDIDVEDASLSRMVMNTQPHDEIPWTNHSSFIPDVPAVSLVPDNHRPSIRQLTSAPELTPLPLDSWKLFDAYTTYTQCWLPICEKLDVLKLSYTYPEEGLMLSPDMTEAGHHAEMWSIFAVGCIQELPSGIDSRISTGMPSPEQLYSIVKLLLPDELGNYDLNHVKALLNLAVFNISRSSLKAAWQLVGAAARIFLTLDESTDDARSRRKNVLASCFLLDNLIALHLERRPYLDRSDLVKIGKIEEDGMEEWQPWNGSLQPGRAGRSRMPTLALSSFNSLLEVVDILVSTTHQSTARNYLHEMIGRLEVWKTTLPTKLEYIRSDSTSIPITPPAVLLQLTYFTTIFALVPSQAWLHRIMELLNTVKDQLEFRKIPPVTICLLHIIRKCSAGLQIDRATRIRMETLLAEINEAFSGVSRDMMDDSNPMIGASPSIAQSRSLEANHVSPQSLSSRLGVSIAAHCHVPIGTTSLLDDLLPDMNSTPLNAAQSLPSRPFENAFDASTLESSALDPQDSYNAFMSGDLESFFDDLASLHGAKKLQNQPQFMQNLGYSSEVSMADLLSTDQGRFVTMPTSSNFDPDNNDQSPHFPLNAFYDAG